MSETALREHFVLPSAPFASYADYRAATGEDAVAKARALSPEAVLDEVARAGLRGRGGAGFPTGTKWRTIKDHPCPSRDVVCNAAEGEPGTFKDRAILRANPYATLEGMAIAAHVVGARRLFIGIKASFTREVARLRAAVDEMRAAGALAGLEVRIVEGPEEYLFGEEKALLEVLSGNEPLPREAHYPPYERGIDPTPTSPNPALVNNVETFARVPSIVRAGWASFRAIGTADTPGPLVFTVSGDVRRPRVYELPAGITLRALFHEVAGGPREGRAFKFATAGVSAGVIPADRFDVPADFASLQLAGSGLGSAGFTVYDDRASAPRVAQAIARFLYVESCNQCPACKHGLRGASRAIDELFSPGTATVDDIPRALEAARSAPQGNRCYLPVEGSIVIPSFVQRFRAEFTALLEDPARRAGRPVLIPKIVDFDEARGDFVYDERQARKRPDWTYAEPEPPPPPPAAVAAAPERTIAVRLAPDVAAALDAALPEVAAEVERVASEGANEVLRAWLRERAGG